MRLCFLAFLLLLPLSAQQTPDAGALLERNGRALKSVHSYQYVSDTVTEMSMSGHPMKIESTTSIWSVKPDKFRMETKSAMQPGTITVSDGEHTWIYLQVMKQYVKKDAVFGIRAFLSTFGIEDPTAKLSSPGEGRVVREETVEMDGEKHDCWVVENKIDKLSILKQLGMEMRDATFTMWLDKKSSIDLQTTVTAKMQGGPMPGAVEMTVKEAKRDLKLNENVPNSVFVFTPPADAKEVPDFALPFGKGPDLAGQTPPKFSVKASDGRTYRPEDLKGKVVLLNFWAPWCLPCRNEIPLLKQLHEEGKILVLSLDGGDDRDAADKLLHDAHASYRAAKSDDGRITGQQIGGNEESLRKLLARAESGAPAIQEQEPAQITKTPVPPPAGEVKAYVPSLMPLHYAHPVVPEASKDTPGMVHILMTIDPNGNVKQAEVLSGPKPLQQAAIDAVKQYKYRPVLRDGHAVSIYTDTMVNFMVKGKMVTEGLDISDEAAGDQRLRELKNSLPRLPAEILADREQDSGGGDEMRRFYALADLAKDALKAGETGKAASYANELLLDAPKHPRDWNYGNAIYDGNLVLGLLAVRQGNISVASQYLLDAGNTPGSPQLNSFGPDMTLAKELLEKGERDAVLEYFSRCRKFWKMGTGQLDAWSETVRNGGTPVFFMNLRLGM